MEITYVSYKVVGEVFTYKLLNDKKEVVEEEIPLYIGNKINPETLIIVGVIQKEKETIEKLQNKNEAPLETSESKENTEENIEEKATEKEDNAPKNKKNILGKIIVRSKLRKLPGDITEEEARKVLNELSEEYGYTFEEIGKIYSDVVLSEFDKENKKRILDLDEKNKKEHPERFIKLALDEYNLIDKYMNDESADKNSLHNDIEAIEKKYDITFVQLKTIYKIERNNRKEKERQQAKVQKRQEEIIETTKIENKIKKMFIESPNRLAKENKKKVIDEIITEFNISDEKANELYEKVVNVEIKRRKEQFKKNMNQMTDEEINTISNFLYVIPPVKGHYNEVQKLCEKYDFTEKEMLLAYRIRNDKKVSEENSKQEDLEQKNDEIIEMLDKEFNYANMYENEDENEIENLINKLSEKYSISSDKISDVYDMLSLKQQEKELVKRIVKVSGQKIPKRKLILPENLKVIDNTNLKKEYTKNELINEGKSLVMNVKFADFKKYVKDHYKEPSAIITALNVMSTLKNGGGINEARAEIDSDIENAKTVVKIVTEFSPYGAEFSKKTRKYTMTKPERLKAFVLEKAVPFVKTVIREDDFEKFEDQYDDQYDEETIEKLKEIREQIAELSKISLVNQEQAKTK